MYKIEITKIEEVRRVVEGEWVQLRDRLPGDKDDNYGYAPAVKRTVTQETVMLVQNVTELNLAAVIKAINGI